MTHVSYTALRATMASHLDRVVADRTELVVMRGRKEPVGIMPLAELESLRETLHRLSTEANAAHLRRSLAEAEGGATRPFDLPDP